MTAVLGNWLGSGCRCVSNPEWPNTANSTGWPKEPLPAVAYVCENNGGAAEDHRSTGMSSQRHRAVRSTSSPVAVPRRRSPLPGGGWLGVLELAHPGRVLMLELALQIIQQVTVRSFNVKMVL